MKNYCWISKELTELSNQGLKRATPIQEGVGGMLVIGEQIYHNFSSNDYLNLHQHPVVLKGAADALIKFGLATSSSRVLGGTLSSHQNLETSLAENCQAEAALITGAGYLANLSAISATLGRNDIVISDRLVHASILDGICLSRARHYRYRHNDLEHLNQQLTVASRLRKANTKIAVVTESVFSMDGDLASLIEIAQIVERFEAFLIVDEAHAFGVFGQNGAGLAFELGCQEEVLIRTGSLSKALASFGGVILLNKELRELLVSKARPFLFQTAIPACLAEGATAAMSVIKTEQTLGQELLRRANYFRASLKNYGIPVLEGTSQIVPVIIGDNNKVISLAEKLYRKRVIVPAIRTPTVPVGSERLRFSITLAHTDSVLQEVARIVAECMGQDLG